MLRDGKDGDDGPAVSFSALQLEQHEASFHRGGGSGGQAALTGTSMGHDGHRPRARNRRRHGSRWFEQRHRPPAGDRHATPATGERIAAA